jgi:beta-lactamase regulating signal transducer with metallopeptidase domain
MNSAAILIFTQRTFDRVVETSWQASVLVLLILGTQWVSRRRLTPAWRCALWLLLLVRLAVPVLPQSGLSLFNLAHWNQKPQQESHGPAVKSPTTTIVFGSLAPDQIANPTQRAAINYSTSPTAPSHGVLGIIWLVGVLFVGTRALIGHWRFVRSVHCDGCPDVDSAKLLSECCARLRITRIPRIIHTSAVDVPAVCGVLRPAVLLSAGLPTRLSRQELTFVLLHELSHLKRRDVLIGWLFHALNVIHWFNPILWLAASRFRSDRELACDARVLALTGRADWPDYGRTILMMLENLVRSSRTIGAVGLGHKSSVHRRIAAIADPVINHSRFSPLALLTFVTLGCATLTGPKQPRPTATTAPVHDVGTVQIYDVRDLLVPILRDATQTTTTYDEFGWPTIQTKPQPTPTQLDEQKRQKLAQLVSTVKERIDPESWSSPANNISADDRTGRLVIAQSAANQEKIQTFFQSLRQSPDYIQVNIKTRFLTGSAVERALNSTGGEWQKRADGVGEVWSKFLSPDQLSTLLTATQDDRTSTTLTAPRLTLFNAQRAFVVVATETAYVADMNRIKATDGNQGFDPVVKTVHRGVVIDAHAKVSDDAKSVALDLEPHLARLLSLDRSVAPGGDSDKGPFIQVPRVSVATLHTSIQVPNDQTAVMRITPQLKFGGAPTTHPTTAADGAPVFILVNPWVIPPPAQRGQP